jgi:antitoxin component YwqK of YwqJK toxin-antitoxin module
MQLIDRNGFAETISTKERIAKHKNTDFFEPQPYQKVLRVYSKNHQGKSSSDITTYHSNGHIWQHLQVLDGRAHGNYSEWYSNGQMKMKLHVIEGFADLSESAQRSWVFDGKNLIWDEDGHLMAEIGYEKGMLHSPSTYFHSNGQIKKIIPYFRDQIDGQVIEYSDKGIVTASMQYVDGLKEGLATRYSDPENVIYEENYCHGLLQSAKYFDKLGHLYSQIENGSGYQAIFSDGELIKKIEFQNGSPKGVVELFDKQGVKIALYHQINGKKCGPEWIYYPSPTSSSLQAKLCLNWEDDLLQGEVKTWYENGVLESQREFHQNKKHGVSFAWYKTSEVMLMEEYDHDKLMKGSYYKKGDKRAVSKIESGKGVATLYSSDGSFLKKISYEKGIPLTDSSSQE